MESHTLPSPLSLLFLLLTPDVSLRVCSFLPFSSYEILLCPNNSPTEQQQKEDSDARAHLEKVFLHGWMFRERERRIYDFLHEKNDEHAQPSESIPKRTFSHLRCGFPQLYHDLDYFFCHETISEDDQSFKACMARKLKQEHFAFKKTQHLEYEYRTYSKLRDMMVISRQVGFRRVGKDVDQILDDHPLFLSDRQCMLKLISASLSCDIYFNRVDERLVNDARFVREVVESNGFALKHVPDQFKCQREVVKCAVQQNGDAIQFAPEQFKSDLDIARIAVRSSWTALRHVSKPIRANKTIALLAISQSESACDIVFKENSSRDLVGAAVSVNWKTLMRLPEKFKADPQIAARALIKNKHSSRYAPHELKHNVIYWSEVVTNSGSALRNASDPIRANKSVVLLAVSQYGHALEFASKNLQNDTTVVMAAVNQCADALQYASKSLRADYRILTEAALQDEDSLQYARCSDEDKNNIMQVVKGLRNQTHEHTQSVEPQRRCVIS